MSPPSLARLRLSRDAAETSGPPYDPLQSVPPTYVTKNAWVQRATFVLVLRRGVFGEIELPPGMEAEANRRLNAPIDGKDIVWVMTIKYVPHEPSREAITDTMEELITAQLRERLGEFATVSEPVYLDQNMNCMELKRFSETHVMWHTTQNRRYVDDKLLTQSDNAKMKQHFSMHDLLKQAGKADQHNGLHLLTFDNQSALYKMRPAKGIESKNTQNSGTFVYRRTTPVPFDPATAP